MSKRAVENAHDQAAQLASAAKVKLGSVRTIVEDQNPASPFALQSSTFDAASAKAAIPVSAGTQDLQIHVKVVYEIL